MKSRHGQNGHFDCDRPGNAVVRRYEDGGHPGCGVQDETGPRRHGPDQGTIRVHIQSESGL